MALISLLAARASLFYCRGTQVRIIFRLEAALRCGEHLCKNAILSTVFCLIFIDKVCNIRVHLVLSILSKGVLSSGSAHDRTHMSYSCVHAIVSKKDRPEFGCDIVPFFYTTCRGSEPLLVSLGKELFQTCRSVLLHLLSIVSSRLA